ncbi:MAG: hypothetical protein Q8P60_13050 [Pseudorhodobacter sp.]|nr:hypothetical protein [Pseudorhodobacter sp.]
MALLLAIALGVAGFGHRAPMQQDATVEAFLLSGFAMVDLCGSTGSDESGAPIRCFACTATGPALIPVSPCVVRNADMQVVAAVFAPRARRTVPAVHDPARAPRAPPLA